MEEKLELMNEAVELVGESVNTGEVLEAVADSPVATFKVLKTLGKVAVVVAIGAGAYYVIKKVKKTKEDTMIHREETEVEDVETVEE